MTHEHLGYGPGIGDEGYWCVICGRLLPSDEGVVVHDNVPHPDGMTFDEDANPQ